MKKITPHLWFDRTAKEAAQFYTTVFPDTVIDNMSVLNDTPSGRVEMASITIMDMPFNFISAGPDFKINPSISFTISCTTKEEIKKYWDRLTPGGIILMELAEYPFSFYYGWVQDKFGVSWQLIFRETVIQKVIPSMLFVGKVFGKVDEALHFYTSVFKQSSIDEVHKENEAISYAALTLEGEHFIAMESNLEHHFQFNEAVSFMVHCDTQEEIDYYWSKLSADPKAEQCGWLKDKFGVSWQIVPTAMEKMMASGDKEKIARVTKAFFVYEKI